MNVLVTGATGYIGGCVVERLLAEGHGVWVLVRDRERALARATPGCLVRTAYFAPTGFAGWAYWYGIYPFHARIFSDLVKAVARDAEALDAPGGGGGRVDAVRGPSLSLTVQGA